MGVPFFVRLPGMSAERLVNSDAASAASGTENINKRAD
jgi:hypothetical protein